MPDYALAFSSNSGVYPEEDGLTIIGCLEEIGGDLEMPPEGVCQCGQCGMRLSRYNTKAGLAHHHFARKDARGIGSGLGDGNRRRGPSGTVNRQFRGIR